MLTAEFLKKNHVELLEMAETCFGIAVSACEDAELAKELSVVVSRLKEKKRHSPQYSCSFKGLCARVFDFEPCPESVNAHLLMHLTKQAFFHCAECKSDLRTSLHAHEGSRGSLSDLRHTFRESYLEVLRLSFPATPPSSAESSRPATQASAPGPSKASEKANLVTLASRLPTASQKTPSHASQLRQGGSLDASILVESEVPAPTPPGALGTSFGPSGGGGATAKTGKRRGDSNGPSPKRRRQPLTIVDSPKSSRQRHSTTMGSRLSDSAASDDTEVVGVRSSGGGAKRRSRSVASPAGPRVLPQFATLRHLSSQLLAATKASTTRSTVMQCGRCKEVLFVSDGIGKLEAHLISHLSGVVSLCEHCGKRFQPMHFAQHNKVVHQSQARHLNLSNNNDVVKNFIACFPEAADWEMDRGPAALTRPASSASGGKTAATSPGIEAQSKGKRVQREMEESFAARAQEFLDVDSAFTKCSLKDCGAAVKVTGPSLSAHVTYHSNKPLFVCLYNECSTDKVKDIELHVRLNHPSYTTYEDLRPQFMPYLLRLLDLCFPTPSSSPDPLLRGPGSYGEAEDSFFRSGDWGAKEVPPQGEGSQTFGPGAHTIGGSLPSNINIQGPVFVIPIVSWEVYKQFPNDAVFVKAQGGMAKAHIGVIREHFPGLSTGQKGLLESCSKGERISKSVGKTHPESKARFRCPFSDEQGQCTKSNGFIKWTSLRKHFPVHGQGKLKDVKLTIESISID